MIVISHALVLAQLPAYVANMPVIGWDNRVTASGIAADSSHADHPASNLGNPVTASRWQGEDDATQYVTFDVGGADSVDYLGIARHNLSATVTVSIEAETFDDPDTWIEIVEEFIPGDNGPIICIFPPEVYSRVRIKLQPAGTIPRMAVVYIGKLLVVKRFPSPGTTPVPLAAADDVFRGRSQSGDYLGSIVLRRGLSSAVSFEGLEYDWYLANMKSFVDATLTTPFFYAWAPIRYPEQVGYAWSTADIRPVMNGLLYIDVSLKIDAVAL